MRILADIAIGDLQPQGNAGPQRALRLVAAEETEGQLQLDRRRSPGRSDATRRAHYPNRMRPQRCGHLNVLGSQHPIIAESCRKILPGITPVPGNLAGNKGGSTRLFVRSLGLELCPLTP